MTTGDFSSDAYQQLREQYAREAQNQRDEELTGVTVQGQELGIETLPVDAPWRDKIDNWQYPDGKSSYQDGQQSPDEILQVMRDAAAEKLAKAKEAEGPDFDGMDDDEFEKFIDDILDDDEDETEEQEDEDDEQEEVEDDEDDDEEVEEEDEEEDEEDEELEGEGLEADEFDGVDPDELEDDDEDEDEEYEDDDDEDIGENEEEVDLDAEDVADNIAALREEFQNLNFYYEDDPAEDDDE